MAALARLIAIVGPTASGKTALALHIAERYNGEIICADSRTIYAGMDVGTAKPTPEEQSRVRHWGLDIARPNEHFSVADFKRYAVAAIADIQSRGKLPLLVGGTGLYVNSVLYDFSFSEKADETLRSQLTSMPVNQLRDYCAQHNIALPHNSLNKRHLVRAIERADADEMSQSPLESSTYIVGIATQKEALHARIDVRSGQLFTNGIIDEATTLADTYGWENQAMTGNIYPLLRQHLDGTLSKADVEAKNATADHQLAKRQMTWFRRNPDIMWCDLTSANTYIDSLLARE